MHNVMKDLKASNTDFVALYTGLKPSYVSLFVSSQTIFY